VSTRAIGPASGCRLCGMVPTLAGGFCVECLEDGLVEYRRGSWRVVQPVWWTLALTLMVELALALPRAIRDDWRAHLAAVAAFKQRTLASKRLGFQP
jgi:hypothetical protein